MLNINEVREDTNAFLEGAETLIEYVDRLERRRIALKELCTQVFPVHHVDPPTVGSLLLYAESGWEGTFIVTLHRALEDAFELPDPFTLIVWTRIEDRENRDRGNKYMKHLGQAGDDVLGESDGNAVVRFYDGRVVDLDDIVAVSF